MIKFESLKQKPGQLVQQFIEEIENIYDAIFPRKTYGAGVKDEAREIAMLRVFMQGISAEIRDTIWNGSVMHDYTWELATKAAITFEKLQVAKTYNNQMAQGPAINMMASDHVALFAYQQKRIEELEKHFSDKTINAIQAPAAPAPGPSRPFAKRGGRGGGYRGRGGYQQAPRGPPGPPGNPTTPQASEIQNQQPQRGLENREQPAYPVRTRTPKSEIECWTCKQKGHYQMECYYNQRNPPAPSQQ